MSESKFDRDMIDVPIAIEKSRNRTRKIAMIREFERAHGQIPDTLLSALARSEWSRGFDDGVRDATGDA